MLTPVGQWLLTIRKTANLTHDQLASSLNITGTRLTLIGHGSRGLTLSLMDRLEQLFQLIEQERYELKRLAHRSCHQIEISLQLKSWELRELLLELQDRESVLTENQVARMLAIVREESPGITMETIRRCSIQPLELDQNEVRDVSFETLWNQYADPAQRLDPVLKQSFWLEFQAGHVFWLNCHRVEPLP